MLPTRSIKDRKRNSRTSKDHAVRLLFCESDIIMLCRISAYWSRFNIKMRCLMVSKKIGIYFLCEDGIEKSVLLNHHLSSLDKPRDAKR